MGAKLVFVDDLDGSDLPQDKANRLTFAVNGDTYRLDLSAASLKKFNEAMRPFVEAANNRIDETPRTTQAPARKRAAKKTATGTPTEDRTAMREWLRENGHDVSDRGNIKKELKDAYYAANPDAAA